jgi:hypothetical protein
VNLTCSQYLYHSTNSVLELRNTYSNERSGACRGAKPLCVLYHSPFTKGGFRGIGLGNEVEVGVLGNVLDSRLCRNDRVGGGFLCALSVAFLTLSPGSSPGQAPSLSHRGRGDQYVSTELGAAHPAAGLQFGNFNSTPTTHVVRRVDLHDASRTKSPFLRPDCRIRA